jgi:hypothetical protein
LLGRMVVHPPPPIKVGRPAKVRIAVNA